MPVLETAAISAVVAGVSDVITGYGAAAARDRYIAKRRETKSRKIRNRGLRSSPEVQAYLGVELAPSFNALHAVRAAGRTVVGLSSEAATAVRVAAEELHDTTTTARISWRMAQETMFPSDES